MSRRNCLLWLVGVALLLGALPASAAGSPWQVWLYEDEIGRMTLINDSGTALRQFILPAAPDSQYSPKAAISSDGRLAAYVGAVYPAGGSASVTLYVYDITLNAVIYNYPLPADANNSLGFGASVFNFSADSSSFAVGYAASGVNWEVLYFNLATNTVFSLRADSPSSVAAGIEAGFGFLVPTVQANRDGQVTFTMIPSGTEGAPSYNSYTWIPATGAVTADDAYVMLDADTLALTGEVVMTLSDPRFPNAVDPDNGFPIFNTLHIYDSSVGGRFPFYASPTDNLFRARFIQGGERVAVLGYNIFSGVTSWLILERSGIVAGVLTPGVSSVNITSAAGLLNGFVYTVGGYDSSTGTTVYYVETRLADTSYHAESVWNSSLGAHARIVWVSDNQTIGNTPFAPWGQLTPPSAGVGNGELRLNDSVMIQTTEGDLLNVRSGPGTTFSRVAQLSNGALVTLVEGPRSGEGFTWWRVRTASGIDGWVVQEADGVQTLIPVAAGPPVGASSLLPAPTPLLPANGTVYNIFPRTTTLVWSPVDGATVYIIEIESCLPGTNPLVCEPYITTNVLSNQTSYTFSFVGAQPGRWRVWAVDVSSQEGAKSDWWTFTHLQ
ncbi:MAG: SH3 domain-containing protein [Anaerolineaceae bacterium]|nr:SH3 domain-containing protein [Anaerolineaceae bacterium]